MCNVSKLVEKFSEWEDYITFVNTDIDRLLMFEEDLYVAYATHNDLKFSTIREWYVDAEDNFLSTYGPEDYIATKHNLSWHPTEDYKVWDKVDEEIEAGTLYECGGYWFKV